jgi:aldose 1-epimerase
MHNGRRQDVVLGYDAIGDYVQDKAYMGAIVGRYANRIAGGQFRIGGQRHDLARNEKQCITLHGGSLGFSKCIWSIVDQATDSVTLHLVSPDGDQGFPGNLDVTCRYWFSGPRELSLVFHASTDQVTPVNLSQHAYFNLDGTSDLAHHSLQIFADLFTPFGEDLIPTGAISSVANTRYDFRRPRQLRGDNRNYDCNFVLNGPSYGDQLRAAAILHSTLNGLTMSVFTSKPGLQFYDGHLLSTPLVGKRALPHQQFAGLCLEPQFFPDSPNQGRFPNCFLVPGECYSHTSSFSFSDSD